MKKTIKDTTTPEFDESQDFLLSDHDQIVTVEAYDEDVTDDDYLGTGTVTVDQLLSSPDGTVDVRLHHTRKGQGKTGSYFVDGCTVTLRCSVFELGSNMASLNQGRNLTGLLTVLVANAYDVPGERKDAAACVKVTFGKRKFCTPVISDVPGVTDGANPVFDATFLVPLQDEYNKTSVDNSLVLTLFNGKEEIGEVLVKRSQILAAPNLTIEQKVDVGKGASVRFYVSLRGVSY